MPMGIMQRITDLRPSTRTFCGPLVGWKSMMRALRTHSRVLVSMRRGSVKSWKRASVHAWSRGVRLATSHAARPLYSSDRHRQTILWTLEPQAERQKAAQDTFMDSWTRKPSSLSPCHEGRVNLAEPWSICHYTTRTTTWREQSRCQASCASHEEAIKPWLE
jgi:hypothetical protein